MHLARFYPAWDEGFTVAAGEDRMFLRTPEAHTRSLVKAVSWRLVGSIDTFVISFFVTGKLTFAVSISFIETFTKILIYYFHERFWAWAPWWRTPTSTASPAEKPDEAARPAPTAPGI